MRLSEKQYLELQAADARGAFQRAAGSIGRKAMAAADPSPLVRKHPWIVLGAAVPAGALATVLVRLGLRRRRRQQEEKRAREIFIARELPRRNGLKRLLRVGYRLGRSALRFATTGAVAAVSSKAAAADEVTAAQTSGGVDFMESFES